MSNPMKPMTPPRPAPRNCNVCGHLHHLVKVAIRNRTFRLCDDCATKVVSDIQRALIPSMQTR